jgi:fatty-acyl-CoA synthase
MKSGDVGVLDQDGYLSIVGRIKDMIIRGGENIYPKEIEEYLAKMPNILDAQVVGITD